LFVQMLQLFNREILQKEKDANWFCPILFVLCSDLRLVARIVRWVSFTRNGYFFIFEFKRRTNMAACCGPSRRRTLKHLPSMRRLLLPSWKAIEFAWLKGTVHRNQSNLKFAYLLMFKLTRYFCNSADWQPKQQRRLPS
jgi:hypothetical protein